MRSLQKAWLMEANPALKIVRQRLTQRLWERFQHHNRQVASLTQGLLPKSISALPLDHLAIIDLPSAHTGIPTLSRIFSSLAYVPRGTGYLADKQNDFTWLAEADSENFSAIDVLPQIVIADFRLNELSVPVRNIIKKYTNLAPIFNFGAFNVLCTRVTAKDESAINQLVDLVANYLSGRDWPLPKAEEFHTVQAANPLLAWVLIFGRQPNHFGISVHLLRHFQSLSAFNSFVSEELKLPFNQEGGLIKGNKTARIEQSSTLGSNERVMLMSSYIELPGNFIEFVWRYADDPACLQPFLWRDFFNGFIGAQANHVIESLSS